MLDEYKSFLPEIIAIDHMFWDKSNPLVEARSFDVISYRVKGSAKINTQDKYIEASPGSILYIPAGVSYKAEYDETEIFCIHFNSLPKSELFPGNMAKKHYFSDHTPFVREACDKLGAAGIFADAFRCWKEKLPGYDLYAVGIFYQILALIKRSSLLNYSSPDNFKSALNILNSEFKNPDLNISKVCLNAGTCETAFRSMFRSLYGKSPINYITQLRLEHAKKLLSQSSVSVEQAALSSGFSDGKYFSRVVKKYYGCTPSALRKHFI